MRFGLRVRTLSLVLISVMALTSLTANAQTTELLVNPGLEEGSSGPYTTRRGGEFPIYLPNSWNIWLASPTGEFFNRSERTTVNPHPGPGPSPKEGSRAINVDCGFVTCTAAIYQQVTVQDKSNVQASAFAQVKACNIPDNSTTCGSAVESGSQTRIGIDPNGGTDPNDGDVVWSNWAQPHDQWLQMTVSATTTGTTATLFLYSTQSSTADLNRTYWDQVSLTGGGSGGAAAGASTPVPTAPPEVAFVVPQEAREDGSIVHIVRSGDTIDSIAVAYGLTRPDILALNPNIGDPRIISLGQEIVVREPLPTEGESFSEEIEETETPDSESTAEASAESTAEAGSDTTAEGDAEATDEAGAESTSEAVVDDRPNPVELAPTAPVVAANNTGFDPSALNASVCVLVFDDLNQNRIQDPEEAMLPGGSVNLTTGADVLQTVETQGETDPRCFEGVSAGSYVLAASAPSGYGLTSPDQFSLTISPGATINVAFGAAQGLQPAAPPADAGASSAETDGITTEISTPNSSPLGQLFNMSGLLVFGLAAVVLAAGVGVALFIRRR
jgi:LysM repeat protein